MAHDCAAYIKLLQGGKELISRFWSDSVSAGLCNTGELADDLIDLIEQLCHDLAESLAETLPSDCIMAGDPVASARPAALGRAAAVRFSGQGITLDRFFCQLKLIRKSATSLLSETITKTATLHDLGKRLCYFFDLFELAVISSWNQRETSDLRRRLRSARHYILQEKKRYHSVFNRMNEPALVVDRDKKILDANQAAEAFFRKDKKNLLGCGCCDVFGRILCRQCGLERILEEKTSFSNFEAELEINGEQRAVIFAGAFLGDIDERHPDSSILIFQDISEKKRYEQQLLISEEKYRSLVENVPDVAWRSDQEGNIIFVSSNIGQIFGYDQEEILAGGRNGWCRRIRDEDRELAMQAYADIFARGARLDICYRILDGNGSWRWFQDRSGLVYEKNGGKFVDGVLSDVTRLKLVEEELARHHLLLSEQVDKRTEELRLAIERLQVEVRERRQTEAELLSLAASLEHSNAELEQFTHVASHDMKEPLMLITAFAERLRKHYSEALDERGNQYVDRIIRSAGQLQRLIDDLLQLARITTQAHPYEPIALRELLGDVMLHLEERLLQTGGQVRFEVQHTLDGDRMQIWQLFQNLICNSLKYRRHEVAPEIVVTSRTVDDEFCEITVEDNGIGFDERYADRIFVPFERLHSAGEYEGTGMGLATCRKIVLRHGGQITARSVVGQGSVFTVRLPFKSHPDGESGG